MCRQWGTEKSLHVQAHDTNVPLNAEPCINPCMYRQQGFTEPILATEPCISPSRQQGITEPVLYTGPLVSPERQRGIPERIVHTEPHISPVSPDRQWGTTEDPSSTTHAKFRNACVLAPKEHVISQAVRRGYKTCTVLVGSTLPRAWMPTLHPPKQRDPLPETMYTQNVPRRLSRQRVSVPGDSVLDNMQASGNSCPAELPDEPRSLCERPRCCDRSRNSVSVQSMSNNMQAGGNTCPAGPLGDADSLPNVPRRCGRQRIPDSFFLSSPNVPRRCGRQRSPDSFFFASSNLPRCCDRQRISPSSSSSCDADCSDSVSFNHTSNSSHSSD